MEAELRALRNELSNRNSSNNHTETQVMSTTVQNDSEDLDNISDNQADEIIYRRHNESPNQDVNEDTDTSFEDKKLSIDLDKPSPENSYRHETRDDDELNYDEGENHSTAHNRHHDTNRCDIPLKTSLDQEFPSKHNGSNGKHKHRNGKTKLSDNGRTNSEKEEHDRETDSETASTTNSREQDSDEQSQSPIPPPTKSSKNDYNTKNPKDTNSQINPSSRSYNNSNNKIESNGGKGHTSSGISREHRQNASDDKKAVNSDKKQLSSSSKVLLPPKKGSLLESGTISSSTNRIHKSLKSEVSRGKDKTE